MQSLCLDQFHGCPSPSPRVFVGHSQLYLFPGSGICFLQVSPGVGNLFEAKKSNIKSSGIRQVKKISRAHWGAMQPNGLNIDILIRYRACIRFFGSEILRKLENIFCPSRVGHLHQCKSPRVGILLHYLDPDKCQEGGGRSGTHGID